MGKSLLSRISSIRIFATIGLQISDTSLRRKAGMFLKVQFFFLSRLIISFKMLSYSVGKKWKLSLLVTLLLIRLILGLCLNFLIAISSGFFKPQFSTFQRFSYKKGVLKICSKFKGEHPCGSMISVKMQRYQGYKITRGVKMEHWFEIA